MPSWLKEGRGSLCGANVSLLLREMGITKPLLVAGERTKNVFFARTGMRLPVFDAFHPNPDLQDCVAGAALYQEKECDGLISVGGGSAMDTAKGIKALLMTDIVHVRANQLPPEGKVPHLAIPGTAGTGAETTAVAVLYEDGRKLSVDHPALLPDGVLLDGSLLDTLPEYHRKSCAMDALAQGIESWWAKKATPGSRIHAERAIRGVLDNLTAYLQGDRKAHGHACMLTLPHLWAHLAAQAEYQPMLTELAHILGGEKPMDGAVLLKGLLAVLELDKIPMPDDATLDMLAASVNPERLGNHPEALTTAQLRAIYVQAFTPMTDTERAEAIAAWEQYGK